jgi:hypothetical protein
LLEKVNTKKDGVPVRRLLEVEKAKFLPVRKSILIFRTQG